MKKIFLYGIIVGVINLVLAMVISYLFMLFPAVTADYKNVALMRAWSDPMMSLFLLYPFVQGIILAWAWNKSKVLFQGTPANRGIKFGLAVWLVASVPGMIISYSSFPLSFLTIISWTVSGLANGVVAGMFLAKVNK